jgi:hypothetical protein
LIENQSQLHKKGNVDMSILTTPSRAFSTSLIYITVGTLTVVWTTLCFVFYPPTADWGRFLIFGFLVTGIALFVIGLLLGRIGRAARHAELPPTEVTSAVVRAEQTAAANPPAVIPVNSVPQAATPIVMESTAPTIAPRSSRTS